MLKYCRCTDSPRDAYEHNQYNKHPHIRLKVNSCSTLSDQLLLGDLVSRFHENFMPGLLVGKNHYGISGMFENPVLRMDGISLAVDRDGIRSYTCDGTCFSGHDTGPRRSDLHSGYDQ